MADFTIKQGSTLPAFADSLTNSDGSAVNLTGATVKFVMRSQTAAAAKVNATATVTNAATGAVSYTFQTADTDTPDAYLAAWVVTFAGGAVQSFPITGYKEVSVEADLTTSTAKRIASLGEIKDYLNISSSSRVNDTELLRLADGVTPVIESIVGPVTAASYDEWHDGGRPFVMLRHRPVQSVAAVIEYRANTAYTLTAITDPTAGTTYSYELDTAFGRIYRRTAGGGTANFADGADAVHVTYTAGRTTVPANVKLGALELIRANYQQTQQGGRSAFPTSNPADGLDGGSTMMGFFVPNRVREMLAPSRRFPSIA